MCAAKRRRLTVHRTSGGGGESGRGEHGAEAIAWMPCASRPVSDAARLNGPRVDSRSLPKVGIASVRCCYPFRWPAWHP